MLSYEFFITHEKNFEIMIYILLNTSIHWINSRDKV